MVANRVQQIIDEEKLADEAAASAEEHRWKAAELIHAELSAGKTARGLAREIGKTDTHVRYMKRTWKRKAEFGDNRPFNTIYSSDEVTGAGTGVPRSVGGKVTAAVNTGWSPSGSGRATAEEGEEAGGKANNLVDVLTSTLARLAALPTSWDYLDQEHHDALRDVPETVAELLLSMERRDRS